MYSEMTYWILTYGRTFVGVCCENKVILIIDN